MKAAVLLTLASAVSAIELTDDTWEEKTAGKTIFVKFFAPWCGHCKAMKPTWDKLMKEYQGHASILIADVDCTADGKSVCESVGVEGFPTIKFGDPSNMEVYEGDRAYDELAKFAAKELGPRCSPANLNLCDAEKKQHIKKFMAMSSDELAQAIEVKDEELKAAEKKHEELVEALQKQYEDSEKELKEQKNEIKESGLGLMKAVKAHLKSVNKEDL